VDNSTLPETPRKNRNIGNDMPALWAPRGLLHGIPSTDLTVEPSHRARELQTQQSTAFDIENTLLNDAQTALPNSNLVNKLTPLNIWTAQSYASSRRAANQESADDNDNDAPAETPSPLSPILIKSAGIALAGTASFWSLRLSGLLTSLVVSRPWWAHLDPIPLLYLNDDDEEGTEDTPEKDDPALDTEHLQDESRAAELLDDMSHKSS
jgi:hypothetical protein